MKICAYLSSACTGSTAVCADGVITFLDIQLSLTGDTLSSAVHFKVMRLYYYFQ